MFVCTSGSPAETAKLAAAMAGHIQPGTVLCLEGNLGAGKTLFVQSLARALGVKGEVTSPTFNLMNIYEGTMPIYHFDLYRLETEAELDEIGFYEYVEEPEGLVVIEWPDKFPENLPEDYIHILIERTGKSADGRKITFSEIGTQETFRGLEKTCQF